MTSSISLSNAVPLDMSKLTPHKASDEMMAKLREFETSLYTKPVVPPDGTYAQVKVGNKVVATVTNNGFVGSSGAMGGKIRNILDDDSSQGPALAQRRAHQIANALGGEVVMAPSAHTQSQWNARPAVTWKLDYEEMERHGYTVPSEARHASYSSQTLASETIAALIDFRQTR